MRILCVGAAIALLPTACGEVKDVLTHERQTVVELPVTPNRDLDLLFVIDDSPSMLDKQNNLAANFTSFLDRLQALPGGLPNLHVGVVTTDMGTKASGSPTPGPAIGQVGQGGCSGTGKGGVLQKGMAQLTGTSNFLIDIDASGGVRTRNYTGLLADTFSLMAKQGAVGCGFEQPLAAMRAALDSNPSNIGFLRPQAVLGVVFLTDEDDCSAKNTVLFGPEGPLLGALQSFRCTRFGVTCTDGGQTSEEMNTVGAKTGCGANPASDILDDVAPYRDFLRGLKSDPQRIVVTGLFGPPEPFAVELRAPPGGGAPLPSLTHSCVYTGTTGQEVADPGARLQALLDGFPDRSAFTSICQRDLSAGLGQFGLLFQRAIGTPCVGVPLQDVKPKTDGLQTDCLVEDLVGASAIEIPSCDAKPSARPCWGLETDPTGCAGGFAGLKLVVQRSTAPDPATVTRMRCVVAPP
jgi:hypothetical protein